MQLYKIKKKDKVCYVTPFQYIEYWRKWREVISKIDSRPWWNSKDAQTPKVLKIKKDSDE